jgi:hypothetical protein
MSSLLEEYGYTSCSAAGISDRGQGELKDCWSECGSVVRAK